jgi:hypothetical protein
LREQWDRNSFSYEMPPRLAECIFPSTGSAVRFRDIYDSNSRVDIMTESQSSYNIFHLNELMKFFKLANHLHSIKNNFKLDLCISQKT